MLSRIFTFVFAAKVAFTLFAFYAGVELGKSNIFSDGVGGKGGKPPRPICTTDRPVLIIEDKNENATWCTGPKVYDHCTANPYEDKTFLHISPKGTDIPNTIFSYLHHPSAPTKFNYIMTQEEDWPADRPIESKCQSIWMTRTGSRSNQPNKCVAVVRVPEGLTSIVQHSHRVGYTALLTNQYQADYARSDSIAEEDSLLPPLLKELPTLLKEFKRKMGDPVGPDGKRRAAIVMVGNEGVMDLVLNFFCSGEASGIDLKSVIVFVGTEHYVPLIEGMGGNAMYSPALGSMPAHAAQGYLDKTFSRMMWFKVTSVFLALNAGFDVLFQDVDLVWLDSPIKYLQSLDQDISFMDDGARTPRYTPFFVNSGFYYVKHNARTLFFMEKMMKCGAAEIGYTHSHQSVLTRHIAEVSHLIGLKVFVLEQEMFPSGQAYHEKKKYIAKIQSHKFMPYVFHMCVGPLALSPSCPLALFSSCAFPLLSLWSDYPAPVCCLCLLSLFFSLTCALCRPLSHPLPPIPLSSSPSPRCWTDNRDNKLVYFKEIGLWYVSEPSECNSPPAMLHYAFTHKTPSAVLDKCCNRAIYWQALGTPAPGTNVLEEADKHYFVPKVKKTEPPK